MAVANHVSTSYDFPDVDSQDIEKSNDEGSNVLGSFPSDIMVHIFELVSNLDVYIGQCVVRSAVLRVTWLRLNLWAGAISAPLYRAICKQEVAESGILVCIVDTIHA